MHDPVSPFNEEAVMAACGPLVPIILREAIESGLDMHRKSRERDAIGFADYRPTTLANMLVDRIYPFLIELTRAADPEGRHIETRDTDNGRATELWIGGVCYAKVKRVHDKVRRARPEEDLKVDNVFDVDIIEYGLPQNIPTGRVLRQWYPVQPVLEGFPPFTEVGDRDDRLCLIAAYDLDVAEEAITRPRIGVCDDKRWHWTQPLPVLETDAIARLSPSLSERVDELRRTRSA